MLNKKLNYFPIEFPKKYALDIQDVNKEVNSLKEKYKEKTLQLEEKYMSLKEEGKELKVDIEFADDDLKNQYADALNDFGTLME